MRCAGNRSGKKRRTKYFYDNAGSITQVVDKANARTNSYDYDSLNRLIQERVSSSTSNYTASYSYDLAGNRTQMVANGQTTTYTCDSGNRLLSWTGGGQAQYDTAGNTTNIAYPDGRILQLAWNKSYELTAVHTNGTVAEKYEYDAFGRRSSISDGTTTNYLVYDGPHVIAETDAGGTLLRSYTHGPGIDNILTMTVHSGGVAGTYRYLKNHQNSVMALVDAASGALVERYAYDAWGNVRIFNASGSEVGTSAVGNRFLFQGREYSYSTGLYNFRARYYDSVTGRWLSKDPIGITGGMNLYEFCGNNPINYSDPFGEEWLDTTSDFCAGVGDTISFGLTRAIRNAYPETYGGVNTHSGAYVGGEVAGTALGLAMGGAHAGRNIAAQMGREGGLLTRMGRGLSRFGSDGRTWGSVRSTWSRAMGGLASKGQSLHHWLFPQRILKLFPGFPKWLLNSGFNYLPISAELNSWMNGSTAYRLFIEWMLKGAIGGLELSPLYGAYELNCP